MPITQRLIQRQRLIDSFYEAVRKPWQWSVQSARIVGMNILIMIQYGVARIHLPEDIIDLC